jgi:hypothetical protein
MMHINTRQQLIFTPLPIFIGPFYSVYGNFCFSFQVLPPWVYFNSVFSPLAQIICGVPFLLSDPLSPGSGHFSCGMDLLTVPGLFP